MHKINTLNNTPFFYILSMGRSGSTLLEFLLDAHPNVNIPLESRFIIHLYYKYGKKTNWSRGDKTQLVNDLYKEYKFNMFWDVDQKKLEDSIYSAPENCTYFDLCKIITANYISFYPKSDLKIQGSKNPIYALWADILYKINKEAKFIHLVRNPLGVISSHKKLGKKNLSYFAYRWNLMNIKIEALKKQTPSNFITIKYEDLVTNPKDTLIEICTFLGIDFQEDQLNFNKQILAMKDKMDRGDEKEKKKMFNSHLKNLIHPINPESVNSWKDTLSEKEIEQIHFITQKVSKAYYYNTSISIGKYKLSYVWVKLILKYQYLKLRYYYKFSMSLK